jgi:superfamily II DNA or RNA helicase
MLSGFEGEDNLRFEWTRGDTHQTPWIEHRAGERVLHIPEGFNFYTLPNRGISLTRRFLVGHSLHPFLHSPRAIAERQALGEPPLILKSAQSEAIRAANAEVEAFNSGQRQRNKFLFVAPTGTGKTEVLTSILSSRLKNSRQKLHILIADQNFLVDQLRGDVEALRRSEQLEFEIRQWGGKFGSSSIDQLVADAEKSDKPIVLVTTIQSLNARVKSDPDARMAEGASPADSTTTKGSPESRLAALRSILGTLAYDEAHHSGADRATSIISELIDHADSKAFLFGTTATPVHIEQDIQAIFGNRAFWAYLDTASSFQSSGGHVNRDLPEIIDQLARAIESGELSPFDKIIFVDANKMAHGEQIFIQPNEDSAHFIINPKAYEEVIRRLAPLFLKHQKGFIAANSVDEANDLAALLNTMIPSRKFKPLHSGLSLAEQKEARDSFKDGDTNFLVTVRQLDEGINYPFMTLYVDLNRNPGPRQFLQRIGRILRLLPNKTAIDVVTFVELNQTKLTELLTFLQNIQRLRVLPEVASRRAEQSLPQPTDAMALDEQDYRAAMEKLESQVKSFWQNRQTEARAAAEELNTFVADLITLELPARLPGQRRNRGGSTALTASEIEVAIDDQLASGRISAESSPSWRAKAANYSPNNQAALWAKASQFLGDPEFISSLSPQVRGLLSQRPEVELAHRCNRLIAEQVARGESPRLPPRGSAFRQEFVLGSRRPLFMSSVSDAVKDLLESEGLTGLTFLELRSILAAERFEDFLLAHREELFDNSLPLSTLTRSFLGIEMRDYLEHPDAHPLFWRNLQSERALIPMIQERIKQSHDLFFSSINLDDTGFIKWRRLFLDGKGREIIEAGNRFVAEALKRGFTKNILARESFTSSPLYDVTGFYATLMETAEGKPNLFQEVASLELKRAYQEERAREKPARRTKLKANQIDASTERLLQEVESWLFSQDEGRTVSLPPRDSPLREKIIRTASSPRFYEGASGVLRQFLEENHLHGLTPAEVRHRLAGEEYQKFLLDEGRKFTSEPRSPLPYSKVSEIQEKFGLFFRNPEKYPHFWEALDPATENLSDDFLSRLHNEEILIRHLTTQQKMNAPTFIHGGPKEIARLADDYLKTAKGLGFTSELLRPSIGPSLISMRSLGRRFDTMTFTEALWRAVEEENLETVASAELQAAITEERARRSPPKVRPVILPRPKASAPSTSLLPDIVAAVEMLAELRDDYSQRPSELAERLKVSLNVIETLLNGADHPNRPPEFLQALEALYDEAIVGKLSSSP